VSQVPAHVLRVGLTGGIATGKSYCLRGFAALGAPVLDADVLAREAVTPGSEGLAAVVHRFGSDILGPAGALDRSALARMIFADADARRDLEAIVHPFVYQGIAEWFAALDAATASSGAEAEAFGVADVPLLFESGGAARFDRVIVAACPAVQQIARLRARDGLSDEDARRRMAAQWPIETKRRLADLVIETSGTLAETDAQVERVGRQLRDEAGRQLRS
jgi:dephospho-CoA kinase